MKRAVADAAKASAAKRSKDAPPSVSSAHIEAAAHAFKTLAGGSRVVTEETRAGLLQELKACGMALGFIALMLKQAEALYKHNTPPNKPLFFAYNSTWAQAIPMLYERFGLERTLFTLDVLVEIDAFGRTLSTVFKNLKRERYLIGGHSVVLANSNCGWLRTRKAVHGPECEAMAAAADDASDEDDGISGGTNKKTTVVMRRAYLIRLAPPGMSCEITHTTESLPAQYADVNGAAEALGGDDDDDGEEVDDDDDDDDSEESDGETSSSEGDEDSSSGGSEEAE